MGQRTTVGPCMSFWQYLQKHALLLIENCQLLKNKFNYASVELFFLMPKDINILENNLSFHDTNAIKLLQQKELRIFPHLESCNNWVCS